MGTVTERPGQPGPRQCWLWHCGHPGREGGGVGGPQARSPSPLVPRLSHSFELHLGSPRLLHWCLNWLHVSGTINLAEMLHRHDILLLGLFQRFPLSEGQSPA